MGQENMENIQDSGTSREEQSGHTASLQLVYLRSGFCTQESIQCKGLELVIEYVFKFSSTNSNRGGGPNSMSSTTNYEDLYNSCIIEEEDVVEPLLSESSPIINRSERQSSSALALKRKGLRSS